MLEKNRMGGADIKMRDRDLKSDESNESVWNHTHLSHSFSLACVNAVAEFLESEIDAR